MKNEKMMINSIIRNNFENIQAVSSAVKFFLTSVKVSGPRVCYVPLCPSFRYVRDGFSSFRCIRVRT